MRRLIPVLFLLGSLISAGELTLDREATTIVATAKATGHSFQAFPKTYNCQISLDDEGAITAASFSCKVSDLTTDKKKRDVEMYHWLDSENIPEFGFTMTRIEKREGKLMMIGNFNLHNKTVELEIPVSTVAVDDKMIIDGNAVLDTRKFDLPIIKKMGFLTVQPEVKVAFHLVGTR